MRHVRELGAGDTGEKVLRAARKPRDLMGHRRAEHEHEVVEAGCEQRVELHGNRVANQAAGELRHLARAQLAERRQVVRAIPLMVEDAIQGRDVRAAVANLLALLRVGHRRMRALRDEGVQPRDALLLQDLRGQGKQEVGVVVARPVRHDREHAGARWHAGERLRDDVAQLSARERHVDAALADDGLNVGAKHAANAITCRVG